MHEVGVAREILKLTLEKAGNKKVKSIKIELGDDGHTTPETLINAFQMVAKGSIAESARLDINKGQGLESRVLELEVEN
ncbi:MAG: hydrogenase/urease maturation nickel metallochaperone HypA [Candidatus Omnitrophica bacterium]|jgi:hydrogenase nickel incorporation protein HypA/HybF|nr:hydrogenase/urease maturation nickel metallochaperone HypA [Candidatus Omnitrophota bacterium]MDD5079645.1 hydrogenase/urease maturation nickel metallochaperone HypA [Candidatus Omnitrophota bacterium]